MSGLLALAMASARQEAVTILMDIERANRKGVSHPYGDGVRRVCTWFLSALSNNQHLEATNGDLLAALKAVEALNRMPHPSGNLDAAVAYRQAERDAWEAARSAITAAEGK